MQRERAAALAALRLLLVVGAIGIGVLWWRSQRAPDFRVDRAVRLVPANSVDHVGAVDLGGEIRDAWEVPSGQAARFRAVVPGGSAVLRFHEGYQQGHPDLSVRLVTSDGQRTELATLAASREVWTQHRVSIPADEGEEIDIEVATLDGRGRPGLGLALLADIVLESDGRAVDETENPVAARSVATDVLAQVSNELQRAPATAESSRVDLPGPLCLSLDEHVPCQLEIDRVPEGGKLHLVLHVARITSVDADEPTRLRMSSGDVIMANLAVDAWARPVGDMLPRNELQYVVDLTYWVGGKLPLTFELEGGSGLFVGVRDLYVTVPQTGLRSPATEENVTNVLLVLIDGLRADRLGAWGYERGHTPVLDGLAARGVRYTHLVAPSSWNMPNVATVLTGVSPLVHGLGLAPGRVVSPRLVTLAQSATWAGYTTACFTSANVINESTGLDRGYELVEWSPLPARRMVERAIDWLSDANQFQWFLTLHLGDADYPHEPSIEDLRLVDPVPDPQLVERLRVLDSRPGVAEAIAAEVGPAYDAELTGVDQALGVLLDALEEQGVLERTLVVVMGTVGQEFYEHGGRLSGQTLYDEVTRVPLIMAGSRVDRLSLLPRIEDGLVELAETTVLIGHLGRILTAASLAGVPPPFGPAEQGRLSHALVMPYAGVTRQWLESSRRGDLLRTFDRATGEEALYDLSTDPGATRNLLDGVAARVWGHEAQGMTEAFESWYRDEILSSAARATPWKP